MGRKPKPVSSTAQAPSKPARTYEPHLIQPTAVYRLETARRYLGLARGTLAKEVRAGRLRVSKRCRRHFFLGSWLLEWLAGGEGVKPK